MKEYEGMGGKKSAALSIIFFILGLIGAIGLRLVLILNHFNVTAARISWYVAMFAFIIFYYYRYLIEQKRQRMIIENKLREKLIKDNLNKEDKQKLKTIVDSLLISKLKINSIILFILTILAVITEIIIELRT